MNIKYNEETGNFAVKMSQKTREDLLEMAAQYMPETGQRVMNTLISQQQKAEEAGELMPPDWVAEWAVTGFILCSYTEYAGMEKCKKFAGKALELQQRKAELEQEYLALQEKYKRNCWSEERR